MANAEYHVNNGSAHAHQFKVGNPGGPGRPKKVPPPEDSAPAICARRGFVPTDLLINGCEAIQAQLLDPTLTKGERIKLLSIYMDTLVRMMEYVHTKLKAVEHSGHIDLLQRLQAVSQCTDEELVRLIADTEAYLEQQS